jgi:hypothetical protein
MAGPWEKYAPTSEGAEGAGPWTKYAPPSEPEIPESARKTAEAYGAAKPVEAARPASGKEAGERTAQAYAKAAAPTDKPSDRVPYTRGQEQYERDVAIAGEPTTSGAIRYALKRASDAATMNIAKHGRVWSQLPSGLSEEESVAVGEAGQRLRRRGLTVSPTETSRYQRISENIPSLGQEYARKLAEENERMAAQGRQYPIAGPAGEVAGTVGSMLLPGGPIAKGAQAIERGVASVPMIAKAAKPLAASAVGATTGGIGGFLNEGSIKEGIQGAAIGAVSGPMLQFGAEKIAAFLRKSPSATVSSAVDDAFRDALAQGRVTRSDLDAIKSSLEAVAAKKGTSPEAAKEGFLRATGVETPTRQQVTGERAIPAVRNAPEVRAASDEATSQIIKNLQSTVPTVAYNPETIGRTIYQLERQANKKGSEAYEAMRGIRGQFDDMVSTNIMPSIHQSLRHNNLPTDFRNEPLYPRAKEAYDYLINSFTVGKLPFARMEDMKNFDHVLQTLNEYRRQANPKDAIAIGAMIDGYKKNFFEALNNNMFTGNSAYALKKAQEAPQLWTEYKSQFYGKNKMEDPILRRAIDKFRDSNGNINPKYTQSSGEAAQAILSANLVKPQLGPAIYDKLEKVIGRGTPAMDDVRNQIRASIFNVGTVPAGKSSELLLADQMTKFVKTNPEMARRVFSPDEIRNMRLAAEAIRVVSARPMKDAEKASKFSEIANKYGLSAIASVVGGAASHISGMPPFLSALISGASGLGGQYISSVQQAGSLSRKIERELAGAPKAARKSPPTSLAPPTPSTLGTTVFPSEAEGREGGYEPGRPARASGGRVKNAQAEAERFIRLAESHKKRINQQTEQILETPDDHVAQALEVANRHI